MMDSNVDGVTDGILRGWCLDPDKLDRLNLNVQINGIHVASLVADNFRGDLLDAGKRDGNVSFNMPLPARLTSGVHKIEIFRSDNGEHLFGSPFTYTHQSVAKMESSSTFWPLLNLVTSALPAEVSAKIFGRMIRQGFIDDLIAILDEIERANSGSLRPVQRTEIGRYKFLGELAKQTTPDAFIEKLGGFDLSHPEAANLAYYLSGPLSGWNNRALKKLYKKLIDDSRFASIAAEFATY